MTQDQRLLKAKLIKGIIYMVLAAVMLPVMNVIAKYLSTDYSTSQIVWARYTGHFLVMSLIFLPKRGLPIFQASQPGVLFVRSMLLFGCTASYFFAIRYIDVATAAAINFTGPLMVTALAVPMLSEKVGIRRWAAVGVGFAGALLIIRPGGDMHWAMLFVLITASLYAIYQILTRKSAHADQADTAIIYTAVVGTIGSTLVLPFFDWYWPITMMDVVLFILVGVIGGVGHLFVIKAFENGEASIIAPLNYMQLPSAAAVSYLVFATFPDTLTWIGATIIIASGLYVAYRESRVSKVTPKTDIT